MCIATVIGGLPKKSGFLEAGPGRRTGKRSLSENSGKTGPAIASHPGS